MKAPTPSSSPCAEPEPFKVTILFFWANLALPEAPRIEHRDTSYSRRPAHEAEFNQFREPDSKPTFSFMLRPRLIQEGIGCKLICCVNGKPQPKVTPRYLFVCLLQLRRPPR